MGEQSNLVRNEAIQKIRDIAKGEVAMFHTADENGRDSTRPMATSAVDEDGTLWFMARADSTKITELRRNPQVKLTYSVSARSEYLALDTRASILRDQAKIDELWTPFAKTWFPNGKEDPAIALIRLEPLGGYYWDTKHNKMVQLAGMVVGAITGKETDDGREGQLRP